MDEIFSYYARTENNFMKFSEIFLFAIERNILSQKIGFSTLYDHLLDCIEE